MAAVIVRRQIRRIKQWIAIKRIWKRGSSVPPGTGEYMMKARVVGQELLLIEVHSVKHFLLFE